MEMEIKKIDSKEIWHICEPKEKLKLSAGFYERYEYRFTCIHCEKNHHHIYNNLTIPANIQTKNES
jgi:hypothetical protein